MKYLMNIKVGKDKYTNKSASSWNVLYTLWAIRKYIKKISVEVK